MIDEVHGALQVGDILIPMEPHAAEAMAREAEWAAKTRLQKRRARARQRQRFVQEGRRWSEYQRRRDNLMAVTGYACVYCGRVATTLDHVTPLAAGGASRYNLVPACEPCNLDKSDLSLSQWLAQ